VLLLLLMAMVLKKLLVRRCQRRCLPVAHTSMVLCMVLVVPVTVVVMHLVCKLGKLTDNLVDTQRVRSKLHIEIRIWDWQ